MHITYSNLIYICVGLLYYVKDTLADNSELLASTLFTFQVHACENDRLQIRCPQDTTIDVKSAHYGRQVPANQMCPPLPVVGRYKMANEEEEATTEADEEEEDTNCVAPKSLKVVLDKCQDEQRCTVRAATRQFGEDPCPSTSKYLQVAYQCKPNEFRSRVACEGATLSIKCKKSQKIAVYSAFYGRSETGEEVCLSSPGQLPGECEADCPIRTVMYVCHGKRRCVLEARRENFGDPCRQGVTPYLSVVYTCVPKRILKEMRNEDAYPYTFCQEESTTSRDGNQPPGGDQGNNGATDLIPEGGWNPGGIPDGGGESNIPPPSTRDYDNITPVTHNPSQSTDTTKNKTELCITMVPDAKSGNGSDDKGMLGLVQDWINTVGFLKENKEKFILYAVLSLCVGIIGVLLIIITRLVQTRSRIKKQAMMDITDPIPSSSPPPPHDDFTSALLNGNHTHPQGDTSGEEAAEIISYNINRPPPFPTDTGTRTFNNYYG